MLWPLIGGNMQYLELTSAFLPVTPFPFSKEAKK